MEQRLIQDLVCPRDHCEFRSTTDELVCSQGHRYHVLNGVPMLLIEGIRHTMEVARNSIRIVTYYQRLSSYGGCSELL